MLAKRRAEVFSRIGKAGLHSLLNYEPNGESIYNMGGSNNDYPQFPVGMQEDDNRSNFTSITNQTTATIKTSKTMKTQLMELNDNTDFLLLDLRDPEEYQKYHIQNSTSFPEPLLNRDKFTQIIYEFVKQ